MVDKFSNFTIDYKVIYFLLVDRTVISEGEIQIDIKSLTMHYYLAPA